MKYVAVSALAVFTVFAASDAQSADQPIRLNDNDARIVMACEECHLVGGNRNSGIVPRLNGQQEGYLKSRFVAFSNPSAHNQHASETMWPVRLGTDESLIPVLAAYFAGQIPTVPDVAKPHAAEGKALYERGTATIPACQSCHGPKGEGNGLVPRVAGQRADYIKIQLTDMHYQIRTNGAMHPTARNMTSQQIENVTAFLANN